MNNIRKIPVILIFALITAFFLIEYSGKKLNKQLEKYVTTESKRIISNVVNFSINQIIEENISDDLFEIQKNSRDEIELLDYNTKEVNKLLKIINQSIQKELIKLEEGKIKDLEISSNFQLKNISTIKNGVLCEIPMGAIKGNTLFANIGPNIPIKLSFIGQVQSNLDTKITSYGINNIVIETNIVIEIEEQITMPTTSEKSIVKIKAPLSIKIIKGKVPNYYASNIGKQSEIISVPLE